VVDGLGNPLQFRLTPGQTHEITQAQELIGDDTPELVIADKAYDADSFMTWLMSRGIKVVIPPRSNRHQQRGYDWHTYREWHLIECFFNQLKHYRLVFSRFDKLAQSYYSFLSFAAALIWMR